MAEHENPAGAPAATDPPEQNESTEQANPPDLDTLKRERDDFYDAARALYAGAPNIERVDRLVQLIGEQKGFRNAILDRTIATVDERLAANRTRST